MERYFGDWSKKEDVFDSFFPNWSGNPYPRPSGIEDMEILAAAYTYEDYSGSAFVLYRFQDKLWEVNGGHCSCYGLEGQWNPEQVVLPELVKRPNIFGGEYWSSEKTINNAIREIVQGLVDG